jgi:hypothetical protein
VIDDLIPANETPEINGKKDSGGSGRVDPPVFFVVSPLSQASGNVLFALEVSGRILKGKSQNRVESSSVPLDAFKF